MFRLPEFLEKYHIAQEEDPILQLQNRIRSYGEQDVEDDPCLWSRRVLDFYPWSKQQELAELLSEPGYVSCRSGNGVGKSSWSAALALHFAFRTRYDPSAICIVIGADGTQLRGTFVSELNRHHKNGNLPGKVMNSQFVFEDHKDPRIIWRSPANHDAPLNRVQGYHRRNMFVILDEANEINRSIWEQVHSLFSGEGGNHWLLAIGNPTKTGTEFHGTFKDKDWTNIHISIHMSPHFHLEEDEFDHPNWSNLPGQSFIDRNRNRTPAWIRSRIDGAFPDKADLQLFAREWLETAVSLPLEQDMEAPLVLGSDVGEGGDRNTLYARRGPVVWRIELGDLEFEKQPEVTGEAIGKIAVKMEANSLVFDALGPGGEAAPAAQKYIDEHDEREEKCEVIPLRWGRPPNGRRAKRQFKNKKAQIIWKARTLLQKEQLRIPNHERLLNELTYFKELPTESTFQVEPKKEMQKQLGYSPDDADGFLHALWDEHIYRIPGPVAE